MSGNSRTAVLAALLPAVIILALFAGVMTGQTWAILPVVGTAGVVVLAGFAAAPVVKHNAYGFHNRTGHSDGHVRRHERGHYNVARRLGAKARIDLDHPDGPRTWVEDGHLGPVERAAIALGGRAAAGPAGCGGDDELVRADLSELPWSQRGAGYREAWRIARRYAR